MKYLFLILSLFTLSVSAQTVLPNPSTVTAATMNAVLTGHITSSTAANDYTGLLTGWTSYPGAFDIRFTNHNTGSATFNLNSIGAKTLKKYSSGSLVDLVSGDISDGEVIRFQYDGTYLIKMGGGSVDVPGSDTQIIRNVSGVLGASSALYYDATNNIFNASSNLTKVGSGSRSNNFYLGIDHTDSVTSSTSNGWNFLQGEHETVSNNGSSGSVINNSFFYGGYRNAIRVKSGSASTIYNSGIIGGQDNYISASNSFLGSSVIIGGIKNRITATAVTRKGIAIIGGEKNIVTGNHSVAIGGYSQSVTDSATVSVPNLNITTSPVIADTTGFVLGRRSSDGKIIKIHASSLGGGGGSTTLGTITADPFNYPASGNTLDVFGGRTRGNLQSVFNAYTLPVISVTNKLVIDGNSNGYGSLLADTSKRYGSVMRSILGTTNYGYHNFSVPGETTLQMTARQSTTNAAFDGGKTHNYLMAFEIENDAYINTSTTYTNLYNHMATWYTAAKSAGFYTIALTAPTRAYYGNSIPTSISVNNKILKADSLLRITTTSYDTLLDIFTLPRLTNNRSSVGYTYDDTHFNPSGHDDIAHAGVSIIRKKLGQQDYTPPHFASWDGNTTGKSMVFGTKDFYPIGFITNGQVRGEFQTNGTFAINGNISAPDATTDPRYRFGVGANQAIALMVTAGLIATTNSDILSQMTIQPSYFDVNGKTGVICDMLRLNKYKSNGYGKNIFRIDSAGRMTHAPSFTAANATDYARSSGSVVTGPPSGNYTQNSFNDTFIFNANSQNHITYDYAPSLTRGSFTGVTETTFNISSGSGATSSDIALKVNASDGIGVDLSNHGGSTTAVNIVSTSSGTGILALMTASGARAGIFYKTSGTTEVNTIRTTSSSNSSGTLDLQSWERTNGSQVAGTGLNNSVKLLSDANNVVRAVQEEYLWKDNVNGSENAAIKWSVVKRGTLSEDMRLETGKLSIGTGSPGALLDIKPGGSAASSAPIKLNYNSITTTGASGTGTVATITFASQPKIPFEVGGTVTISGVTPSGYNGTYTVTAATLIAVSFTNSTTGSQTVAGIVETGTLTTPESGAIERDKNHLYFTDASGTRIQLDNSVLRTSGSFSATGTATTTFTVTFGNTQAGTSYKVTMSPTSILAVGGYVTNKTTTTFDYVVPAATGTVSLDYEVIP